jgi:anti-sigma regulatory factor (Ser/Thr protein kinase)
MPDFTNPVFHLTLQAKVEYLPEATALVRGIVTKMGLGDQDARRMELVVEEACVNVIEHAFENSGGSFDISLFRRPGQIVIAVDDLGLPIDFNTFEAGEKAGLGISLMRSYADEVHFLNLGRHGKRVELIKNLVENKIPEETPATPEKSSAAPFKESEISVRPMRPEEAAGLARCAYRVYGYTYSTDAFYYPERIRELVAGGLMVSIVAVDPLGEIVGHVSITKEKADSTVGESGQAIVDPRYRGHGFHKEMGVMAGEICKAAGLLGSYSEGVTVHPYSQKTLLFRGYLETGLLLGYTPASMFFKEIQGEATAKRRAVVLFYKRLNEEPWREVYLPERHRAILDKIYSRLQLNRRYTSGPAAELPALSAVNIKIQAEASRAFLRVVEYGRDLVDLIGFRLKELCVKRLDCIYLDLPLSHPAVQEYLPQIEKLGFFFGGVIPEASEGDILRLQYINHADLELKDVQLATDFAKELLQYVLKEGGLEH